VGTSIPAELNAPEKKLGEKMKLRREDTKKRGSRGYVWTDFESEEKIQNLESTGCSQEERNAF